MSAIGTKPKGEVIFKRQPMQFAQILERISARLAKEGGPHVGIGYDKRHPDPSVLDIELTSPNPGSGQLGRLEMLKTGEGKSSVVVAANRDESLFAEWWEPIITEMERMRLLDTLQPSATDEGVEAEAGEKTNASNDLHMQILDKGYDREMLKMWRMGHDSPYIGRRLDRAPKTILNNLAVLRRTYGDIIVPRKK